MRLVPILFKNYGASICPMRFQHKPPHSPQLRNIPQPQRQPQQSQLASVAETVPLPTVTELFTCAYNLLVLAFITVLIFSELLGIFYDKVHSQQHLVSGRDPVLGAYSLKGTSDEPYSDRALACVQKGRVYHPVQVNHALELDNSVIIDTSGSSISGYRTVTQQGEFEIENMDIGALDHYTSVCSLIASTLTGILHSCRLLGYNVTDNHLRIVNGLESSITHLLTDSLPVVILPISDNATTARYVVPGWDGSACMFHLSGKYVDSTQSRAVLSGVNRTSREALTANLLNSSGGTWRNGWYEDDTSHVKWHSDVTSSQPQNTFNLLHRQFDTEESIELDCLNTSDCDEPAQQHDHWEHMFSVTESVEWTTSILISNGKRYGLYFEESLHSQIVKNAHDLPMFISDITVEFVIFRWFIAAVAMLNGYRRFRMEPLPNIGISCLSDDPNFTLLPLLLLPRVKILLATFLTIGCEFDGEQVYLAESWFVMYPAIAEFILMLYSLLNLLAGVFQRRVSDVLFGPTLLFLCLLHELRHMLIQAEWLGMDGPLPTLVSSAEFDSFSLIDFITSNVALQMNGNAVSIFTIKLVVLGINTVGLLILSDSVASPQKKDKVTLTKALSMTETTLVLEVTPAGGLGRSLAVKTHNHPLAQARADNKISRSFSGYELCRVGYLVLGDDAFVITFEDWVVFLLLSPFKSTKLAASARVMVFPIIFRSNGTVVISKPRFVSLDDDILRSIQPWQIAVHPFD